MFWAFGLIIGFALLQHGIGEHVHLGNERVTFWTVLYMSGETFFTLGLGDVAPISSLSRALTVLQSGLGFAFLGVVIGYLPTIYSSFSRREVEISLLDARAGSPPTAAELLGRLGNEAVDRLEWAGGGEFRPLDRPGMAGGQLVVARVQRCPAILLETLALPPWFRKGVNRCGIGQEGASAGAGFAPDRAPD